MDQKPVRVVILASGEGSLFEALVTASRTQELAAEIVGLITNKPDAPVLRRAHKLGIPAHTLGPGPNADDELAVQAQTTWQAEWIVLAGYLRRIGPKTLRGFPNRIVNIHPSLLPKFGGKGMYGLRVHEAVIRAGELVTGITVHLINEFYDQGAIISQVQIPLPQNPTPEALAAQVKAQEIQFYPRVLNRLFSGQSTIG